MIAAAAMSEESIDPKQTVFAPETGRPQGAHDILIIDDDDNVSGVLEKALKRQGYAVWVSKDGKSGLALLAQHPFRLVITDIFMPDMDGYQVIMKVNQKTPKPGLLAMSGGAINRAGSVLKTARLLGCEHILPKPFELADVYTAVSEIIGPPPGKAPSGR
jgi:CheY-like chemotaxis protein